MVDFETQPGAPKQFVIDGITPSVVETMMAVADRFEKTGTVRAITAGQAGSIVTPEGTMRFGPGDMIVSDEPPTHAWPVRRDIFERTYRQIADAVGQPLETGLPFETFEPPVPTGDDAELYQPDPATIEANPANGPDFERIYDGFAADDEEDVTGITDEELVEEVPITSEDPIPPNELVRPEDTTGTVLRQKRKGRRNRKP